MLKHRRIDLFCMIAAALAVAVVVLFMNGKAWGLQLAHTVPPYEKRLFDQNRVHTIDLVLQDEDWLSILEDPYQKEYVLSTAVIDGEAIRGVGLRAKGNNSLGQVLKYGSKRFGLKIEFDHFERGKTYHGLDKISLNPSFQDNAYLKETMAYDMMAYMGVPTPLTSYAYLTINGEDWGLFVVAEDPENAFVRRNFGAAHGMLYKPEYMRLEDENNDVALLYAGDDFANYENIFRKSIFNATDADKRRLIASLQQLSKGEDLQEVVNIDAVLNYFVVQSFVVNLDGYLGVTGHNYFLYEENGRLSMLPWDYNLAYGTYALGTGDRIDDATKYINQPIDTPAAFEIMVRRPMFYNLLLEAEYLQLYHKQYASFLASYFESGLFEEKVNGIVSIISPYVKRDPTKFCTYEDFLLAVDTFKQFCLLRAQSVRGQLSGTIPSTIRGQAENPTSRIDASSLRIADLGDFKDMESLVNGRIKTP